MKLLSVNIFDWNQLHLKVILVLLTSVVMYSCSTKNVTQLLDCDHTSTSLRCVRFVGNYDGDTFTVNIPGIPPLFGHKISVRIRGIDTPEITGKAPCEKERAQDAKRFVYNKLSTATSIQLHNVARDKYFRILADVILDGVTLSSLLIKSKLAIPYDGGAKESIDWCSL